MRKASDIYNEIRSELRDRMITADDKDPLVVLINNIWDAAYSEGVIAGSTDNDNAYPNI